MKTKRQIMEQVLGKDLQTPRLIVRVFHIDNPDYTYRFVRQEGDEILVVDDKNGADEEGDGERVELKMFPANKLVNPVVFEEACCREWEKRCEPAFKASLKKVGIKLKTVK